MDEFPNCGPVGGIHSALRHSNTDWNLFLAVDMPLVPTALLQFIAAKCDFGYLAVVPEVTALDLDTAELESKSASKGPHNTQAVLQPLCAAYHRDFLPLVERALSNRELSIRRLLEQAAQGMMGTQADAIRILPQPELTLAGFSSEVLINVNTPADLERAKGLAERFHVN
jgi:molybdopterin-guanine dinucleotide biosynthesis protein A